MSALKALTNGRVWHLASIGFTLNIGMYSLSFWMPGLIVERTVNRFSFALSLYLGIGFMLWACA
jgi:hypothetical protein